MDPSRKCVGSIGGRRFFAILPLPGRSGICPRLSIKMRALLFKSGSDGKRGDVACLRVVCQPRKLMGSVEGAPRFEDFITTHRSMLDRRAAFLCRGKLDASEV